MSTGTKRSGAKPKPSSKVGKSLVAVYVTPTDKAATIRKVANVTVHESAIQKGKIQTATSLTTKKRRRQATNHERSHRDLKAEVESLTRRVALLERELLDLTGNREARTPEFIADCAEIERVLGKRFKSVSTRPLSAGQIAVDVTDVAFKGLSWMKRHALLDPILDTLSERAFFRVIETHLRTPDETD